MEGRYIDCLHQLWECQECDDWGDLSLEMKQYQPKLYQLVLNCYLLASHSEIKLERYRKAADTCDHILRVEENFEAYLIKGASLAAISMFPEAIVCYKKA